MYRTISCAAILMLTSPVCGQSDFDGKWQCYLNCPGGKIRFGMEIQSQASGQKLALIINGSEKIPVSQVKLDGAEFEFRFDHYDSNIKGALENDRLKGIWKKRRGNDKWVEMEFVGERTTPEEKEDPPESGALPFNGRWAVDFEKSEDPAVGIFQAVDGNRIAGTFLTTTGDYRFLFGHADASRLELSCFDGAHAFLFKANIGNGVIEGKFWSSNTWQEKWTARKDDNAELPDPFSQTLWTKNASLSDFSFPDLNGLSTKLDDPKFDAAVKLIYVFGSWCPNCHDAAAYFKQLKSQFGDKLMIVGIAFEHTGNFQRDSEQVQIYLRRHNVDYPVLIGGLSDKKLASKATPFLDRVRSFPTTIFVDSNQQVRAIHTGFTGPATGIAYTKMKARFEALINRIANE